jgi:hypothetical protein
LFTGAVCIPTARATVQNDPNADNGGYLIPFESVDRLCDRMSTGDELRIDVAASRLHNLTTGEQWMLKSLGEIAPILEKANRFVWVERHPSGAVPLSSFERH